MTFKEDLKAYQARWSEVEAFVSGERLAAKGVVSNLQLEGDQFAVDKAQKELDAKVIQAMETGNEELLKEIPENVFKVGTAEIKNWFAVISAMNAEGRKYHSIDYVPCYRSEAGTGNAMAFGYWE